MREQPSGTRMRRVLHVINIPFVLKFLRGQAAFMRTRGYELGVALGGYSEAARVFSESEGVPVFPLAIERRMDPMGDLRSILQVRAAVRDWQPDLVHASTPKGGLVGSLGAALAGVPRLYQMRGSPLLTATGLERVALGVSERVSCWLSHEVVLVSPSLRTEMARRGVLPSGHGIVFGEGSGQGVDTQRFHPGLTRHRDEVRAELGWARDAYVIGFVGRLVRDKGIDDLLGAFTHVRAVEAGAKLLLVGDYEDRDAVPEATRARIAESPDIVMTGFARPDRYYGAMDVLAFPSYREGFPNVPLEAAAAALPIVCTSAIGAVDAIVPNETGLLIPPGDPRALSDALLRYADDPSLRAQHGRAGRERTERSFQRERLWGEMADTYDRILARRGRGSQ